MLDLVKKLGAFLAAVGSQDWAQAVPALIDLIKASIAMFPAGQHHTLAVAAVARLGVEDHLPDGR